MYKITLEPVGINGSVPEATAQKTAEINSKIIAYKTAQELSLNGGPGPVADYEIMAIVNEYGGLFEVIAPPEVIAP